MKKPTRVERKRRRKAIFFRLILILALASFLVVYAFKSDYFNIAIINLEGNDSLEKEFIINASGISLGENILRIKTSSAEKEIESLPYVKNVIVKRKLPKTINISVKERVAVIQLKALSSYILIDNEGYVLDIVEDENVHLPVFIGFNINEVQPGSNIILNEEGRLLEDFFNDDEINYIVNKISEINYLDKDNVNINLNNGIGVAFGPLYNVKYKLRLLDKILLDIENKQIPCKMIIMNKGENPIIVTNN
jgi:cell division protein FtsQ